MSPVSSGIKQLHDLRLQLGNISDQLERGPRQIQVHKQAIEKKKEELNGHAAKLKQLKVSAEQNLQLKSSEARIYDLNGKLNVAANNREYEALHWQIAADTMAKSVLEDEILEAFEIVDRAQAEVKKIESELSNMDAELQKLTADIQSKESRPQGTGVVTSDAGCRG